MRRFLLDTCVVIWVAAGTGRALRAGLLDEIRSPENACFVSAITVAEIARLSEKKRISLRGHWKPWLRQAVMKNGWNTLDVTWPILEEAWSLPGELHDDPADRILVATARLNRLVLATGDQRLLDYPHVDTLW